MMENNEMRVTKRNGKLQEIAFDKILNRIKKLGQEAAIQINYSSLVMKVIDQLYDKIPTTKIDELAAEQCASLSTLNPDYGTLLHDYYFQSSKKYESYIFKCYGNIIYFKIFMEKHIPLVSEDLWNFARKYSTEINNIIDYNRDYLIDYFGFKTFERAYLFKINDIIIERPQHMWMRVCYRNSRKYS